MGRMNQGYDTNPSTLFIVKPISLYIVLYYITQFIKYLDKTVKTPTQIIIFNIKTMKIGPKSRAKSQLERCQQ